ncbi:RNA methyltransferase [Flagellimonas meishanensis]|uniref:RNA methyltransferase n=1 Tax=Flagellimonas meishanensis TaxID=2873264 RepID=UPI001CA6E4D6|nr:RNA methyltransferase [[Muricauda] meishanensis]
MGRKLENSELGRLDVDTFKQAGKSPIILILDNIRSLNNIGSVFRTADAFLVKKIYLCGITATPPHKDIRKTALGATESVDWEYRENIVELITELQRAGAQTIAVEQAEGSIMLNDFEVPTDIEMALVFGNEVKGVSQEVVSTCDSILEIPQFGTKHSLNIAVSVGVVVWDVWNKIQKSPINKKPRKNGA